MLNEKLDALARREWSIDEMEKTIQDVFDQITTTGESYLVLSTMLGRLTKAAKRASELEAELRIIQANETLISEL